jgi:quercetin dioxygenase-like cupin family protein
MRRPILLCSTLAIVLVAGLVVLARPQTPQTPVGISRQTLFENAHVRVMRLKLAPGAMEDAHTHPYDVVVTTLTPADMTTIEGETVTKVHREANYAFYIPKGTRHAGGNYGKEPYEVLVVAILK